jgi:hypothetical protein
MDSKRISLLSIAVVAIGIFALPSTMSLFAGQHVWYDLAVGGNDVPCEKCHADVAAEMDSQLGPHMGQTGYGRFECGYCHRLSEIYTYASGYGSGSTPGIDAHAASTIPCMHCHSGNTSHGEAWTNEDCYRCHLADGDFIADIDAGGFGLSEVDDLWSPVDTGNKSAHLKFVLDAIEDDTMAGANEACIACHTMIGVKINWTHARSLEFDIGIGGLMTTETGVHNWTMTNWSVNGTANVTVWGNTSGAGSTSSWDEWPGNVNDIYS